MLPTCLSEGVCSLKAGSPKGKGKAAFYMEFFISETKSEISNITFGNCLVNIKRNYVYEEPNLLKNPDYILLKSICNQLFPNKINDSHDVVSELMILMNMESAKYMSNKTKNNIVYRATKKLQRPEGKETPTAKRLTTLKSDGDAADWVIPNLVKEYIYDYAGEYTLTRARHETMDKEYYIHITSPIRRIVDTLNMMTFQLLLYPNLETNPFYEQWFQKMDYINESAKAIKKTQSECELLDLCTNDPSVLEKEYEGIIFGDVVFLKELNLFSRYTTTHIDSKNTGKFKLFLFHEEEFFRKKVRVSQQE